MEPPCCALPSVVSNFDNYLRRSGNHSVPRPTVGRWLHFPLLSEGEVHRPCVRLPEHQMWLGRSQTMHCLETRHLDSWFTPTFATIDCLLTLPIKWLETFKQNERCQISWDYFVPHLLYFCLHCVLITCIWQSPVAMRNASKFLRHTGVMNMATEVALSFLSDVEDHSRKLQVSKAM